MTSYYDEASAFRRPTQELTMPTKGKQGDGTTITINCGTTCQKVTQAGFGVACVVVAVPAAIGLFLLYARGLYDLFYWMLGGEHGSYHDANDFLATMGAVFGSLGTVGLCAALVAVIFSRR